MYLTYRHPKRFKLIILLLQETWRIDWRTPNWLPVVFVVTLRRWIE
jgi:hypothetical protein